MGWTSSNSPGARDVATAFYEGRSLKRGNCETDGRTYKLFGNTIARRIIPTEISDNVARALLGKPHFPLTPEFSFSGWPTSTTCAHLGALGVQAYRAGGPRMNGKLVDEYRWYTRQDIDNLFELEPPKLRREPRFVNLTLPLFA